MKNKYLQVLIFIAVFWFSLQPATDPDTGWHIATGRQIVATKSIPKIDSFSYSLPNHPYVAHSWASDVISFMLVDQFGIISLSVLYALLSTISLIFIAKISSNLLPHPTLPFLLPIITYPAIEIIGQRPQAFSVLGMTILLYLLTKGKNDPSLIWQVPLLFIIWTNTHGGVILGLAIIVMWWLQAILSKSPRKTLRTLTLTLGAAVLGTLINPYTYKIFVFAWGMITNSISFAFNTDWVPLFSPLLGSDSILLRAVIIVVSGLAIIDNKGHRYLRVLSIVFTFLALKSIRFLVPLLVVVSPLILQTIARALKSVSNHKAFPILPALLISALLFVPLINKKDLVCSIDEDCYSTISQMPYSAVKYMKDYNLSGSIFNFYTWGGYLSWQLPESKIFIDGRMDNFFHDGKSFLSEFVYIHQMRSGWYKKLDSYNTDFVLIPISWSQHTDFLEEVGWEILIKDELSILMSKPS